MTARSQRVAMGRCWSSCQPCGETPENFPPLLRGRTNGQGEDGLDGPFHPAFEVDEDKVEEREMQEITLLLSDVKQLYAGVPPWPISSHVQLLNRHFYKTKRVLDTSTGCRMTVFKLFALQIASDAGPFLFVNWPVSYTHMTLPTIYSV